MRELSYSFDRTVRVVEHSPTPAHGVIYQVEQMVTIPGAGVAWRVVSRAVAPPGKMFVDGAWRQAHAALAALVARRAQARPRALQ